MYGPTTNVTVSNSTLLNNSFGMSVGTGNDLTLINVNASDNDESGVIANVPGVTTVNGGSFSNNTNFGIDISWGSGANLSNFTANNNSTGISMDNVGDITINDITANNNTSTGISISDADNISLTGVTITSNEVGLYVKCVKNVNLRLTNISGNRIKDISIDPSCPSPIIVTATPVALQVQGQFTLDCSKQAAYPVQLPNGDLVNIFCPVSGTADIYRLDNTGLPANLPEGYTYASAFTLDIDQQGIPIPVITEGGYVKSSFVAQPLQPGNTYTVLYWDPWINESGNLVENPAGGSWVPLKDFLLDGNGNLESFDLFPGTDDPRKIISGVNLVSQNNVDRVEVSTNFPGIFVLAQH